MIIRIERGKHLTADFNWVDFVVRNTDIITALNLAPLRIRQISSNQYTGTIFGVRVYIEQLKHEHTSKRGTVTTLADVRLPCSLGRTYTTVNHLYYAVDEKITSIQVDLKLEVLGLMSLYARMRKRSINNYIDRICSDIQTAARLLASEDASIGVMLNECQQNRVAQYRKSLAETIRLKSAPSLKVQASLGIVLINNTIVVEADAVMPDRHFLTARNEVKQNPDQYKKIQTTAAVLAAINNPAFAVRGQETPPRTDIEFRQAAFEFGHSLYRDFFSGKLTELMPVLLHYENNAFLRLDIDGQIENLPWEALHDGRDFLSTKLCFSRVLGAQSTPDAGRCLIPEKLGILLVGSDARGDLPNAVSEVRNIAHLLSKAGLQRIELLDGAAANRSNVLNALNSGRFNVLHFSGHSVFNPSYPYQSYMELDRSGRLFLHELDDLKVQGIDTLGLVFLNSCQSGKPALDPTTGRNLSMCRTLRESGVGNVIGMLWNISDDAAIQFASVFYTVLTSTAQFHVVEAMRQTRSRVAIERAWQDGSWLAPVLYT